MSHFTVVVLVPQDKVPEPGHPDFASKLTSTVEAMLAPFDENMNVKPYQETCDCAKWRISHQADKLASEETGLTWDGLRNSYHAIAEDDRPSWKEFVSPLASVEARYRDELGVDAQPDADCEECHGAGFYKSTYNPRSKWDWYSFGGRWAGDFKDNNIPTVIDDVAFAVDLQTAPYTPFAIVSPREPHQKQVHDNWSEKGQMGWFGISSNENDNWPAIAFELFGKYNACFAVLMDCHI